MINYEIRHTPSETAESTYSAVGSHDEDLGWLTYQPEANGIIDLVFVRSNFPGLGIAKNLLKTFVSNLREDSVLTSMITHDETVRLLETKGFLAKAKERRRTIIKDQSTLHSLPIVQILDSGEIQTTQITISHIPQYENTEEFPYNVRWKGKPKAKQV